MASSTLRPMGGVGGRVMPLPFGLGAYKSLVVRSNSCRSWCAGLSMVFSTLMCFLNERCESHNSPRNFVDSSTGRSVFPILTIGGLWAWDRGAVKCMTLHLWAANLKPFFVAHSCMAFTACCRCLSMVSRERPRKQIARSSTKRALKMSLAIQQGSLKINSEGNSRPLLLATALDVIYCNSHGTSKVWNILPNTIEKGLSVFSLCFADFLVYTVNLFTTDIREDMWPF